MHLENYTSSVLRQLGDAKTYFQVEVVITDFVELLCKEKYPVVDYLGELETKIEKLSPLHLSSTQFSCYRYALLYLRSYVTLPQEASF
ncbi:hypothetical protein [Pedobacter suwonensis]|uniref:hypothetical protein n=1 Tax=Pedobacter suwonensis TaxID=332999 RepID=UPI00369D86E8